MYDSYIKQVIMPRGSLGVGSAKHDAPQPSDIMPATAGAAVIIQDSAPGQPLTDGVVRVLLDEIRDGDCAVLGVMALISCPGCVMLHGMWVRGSGPGIAGRPQWDFDGNISAPTFSPSLLVSYGHGEKPGTRCHSFVRGGRIQFLDDSSQHHLRGWHDLPAVAD